MSKFCNSLLFKLNRKKYVDFDNSSLARVLTLLDLTALGVGSTIGVGFYILAGQVARNSAGPAVVICFLVAAIASVFAGLCYAEFGARVPKAGSAYVYSYVCVGEFVAFVIGWNLILEYVIGAASVARGYSGYVDYLVHGKMSNAFRTSMPLNVNFLSEYPDFFAFTLIILVGGLLSLGVKESTRANNIFTGVNIFVVIYFLVAGLTKVNSDNWHLTYSQVHPSENNTDYVCENLTESEMNSKDPENPWGSGGFSPYGFSGIMQGAATCFFGFVGFDIIATTGEEAKRPERNIPLSICLSLLIIFLAYFGMSTVLTLAVPYCAEDPSAPLIDLFKVYDMTVSAWIVSVGALFGFSASLLGVIFPMPRILYAMADDGLIFRFLSRINRRFETPMVATLFSSLLAGVMALFFSIDALVDMMSIGTLMAYTIVAICVMLLRYTPNDEDEDEVLYTKDNPGYTSGQILKENLSTFSFSDYIGQIFNQNKLRAPTDLTSSLVTYATWTYFVLCFLLALFLTLFGSELSTGNSGIIALIVIFFLLCVFAVSVIAMQPQSNKKLSFKVPLVPLIPAFSSFFNLYLMCNLSAATWIRFVVWMFLGLLLYFLYGLKHSSGSDNPSSLKDLNYDSTSGALIITKTVPEIKIQSPTPAESRLATPTNTLKSKSENSTPLGNIAEGAGENGLNEYMNVNPIFRLDKTQSSELNGKTQSVNISPPALENHGEFTESEDDVDENTGQDSSSRSTAADKKSTSSVVVTSAIVYSSNDPSNYHEIPQLETSMVKPLPSIVHSSALSSEPLVSAQISSNYEQQYLETTENETTYVNINSNSSPRHSGESYSKIENKDIVNQVDLTKSVNANDLVRIDLLSDNEGNEKNHTSEHESNNVIQDGYDDIDSLDACSEESACSSNTITNSDRILGQSLVNTVREDVPVAPSMFKLRILKKASSFDEIPPSSPDSPLAQRFNKFLIIPVSVPNDNRDDYLPSAPSLIADLSSRGEENLVENSKGCLTDINIDVTKAKIPLAVEDINSNLIATNGSRKDSNLELSITSNSVNLNDKSRIIEVGKYR